MLAPEPILYWAYSKLLTHCIFWGECCITWGKTGVFGRVCNGT
jgi:hypothetical protein